MGKEPAANLPASLTAVFCYLDQTLEKSVAKALVEREAKAPQTYADWNTPERGVQDYILNEFRLMHWGSPLRKALDPFRLYHRDDMSHALTQAYRLHLRGEYPVVALQANYGLGDWGLLTWTTKGELVGTNSSDRTWDERGTFYRPGDRLVHYSRAVCSGTLLVRGDRLVWSVEHIRLCISSASPRGAAARDLFQRLGGTRGFLSDEFTWPPENWANRVTDETGTNIFS